MRTRSFLLATVAFGSVAGAQQKVPVRELSPASAKSSESFGTVFGVRQLPGGKLLLNDATKRRVLMLDSTLSNPKVVIDSTAGAPNSYGAFATPIIPYLGDSTLF